MSSGFITESELAEARKRRQEEWEKVRTADQPLERPEEYDSRSLYDRLKEQKMKKDLEYEEAHKLKNLIRGLDDDEVSFLELVDKNKIGIEKEKLLEEERELKDFRNRVTSLQEESENKKIQSELKTKVRPLTSTARPSQKSLLGIGIKRKNGESVPSSAVGVSKVIKPTTNEESDPKQSEKNPKSLKNINTTELDVGHFKCVAILPGLGPYNESSDSEISSGSEDEPHGCDDNCKYDLVGRKHEKKKHSQDDN
ncbi:PSME3-interacting protein [Musca vetustissima]|uniref:PSME3-interacting protein n=1 Tax=Musca vetustissima TaxID=27455 RepID=UPI002AB71EE1|nr:PSME3-interacting protein [Musca vetustissima]